MILLSRKFESVSYFFSETSAFDFMILVKKLSTTIKRCPMSLKDFRFHYAGILFHFRLLDLNEITELDLRVLLWFSVRGDLIVVAHSLEFALILFKGFIRLNICTFFSAAFSFSVFLSLAPTVAK